MDDFTAEYIADGNFGRQRTPPPEASRHEAEARQQKSSSGLRGGFAALREKANIQDRLVEK